MPRSSFYRRFHQDLNPDHLDGDSRVVERRFLGTCDPRRSHRDTSRQPGTDLWHSPRRSPALQAWIDRIPAYIRPRPVILCPSEYLLSMQEREQRPLFRPPVQMQSACNTAYQRWHCACPDGTGRKVTLDSGTTSVYNVIGDSVQPGLNGVCALGTFTSSISTIPPMIRNRSHRLIPGARNYYDWIFDPESRAPNEPAHGSWGSGEVNPVPPTASFSATPPVRPDPPGGPVH